MNRIKYKKSYDIEEEKPEGPRRRRGAREESQLGTCQFEEGSFTRVSDVGGRR